MYCTYLAFSGHTIAILIAAYDLDLVSIEQLYETIGNVGELLVLQLKILHIFLIRAQPSQEDLLQYCEE